MQLVRLTKKLREERLLAKEQQELVHELSILAIIIGIVLILLAWIIFR